MIEDTEGLERDHIGLLIEKAAGLELADKFVQEKIGLCVAHKYRLNELVASGGMGAVYRATHVITGRVVALKSLLPSCQQLSERFVREAKASARIRHPNVTDVYDIEWHQNEPYLVMELLQGRRSLCTSGATSSLPRSWSRSRCRCCAASARLTQPA